MSSQTNTYVMVGSMLPYDRLDVEHDDIEAYRDSAYKGVHHHNGLCVIADGMGGKYIAVGRILAKTDDQNGNYGFNEPIDLDDLSRVELRIEVEKLISEHFGIEDPDVRDWVFTNYR
jgi:serine/threonine protein phosphatase PrpC